MHVWDVIILGIVQGLTEFLPVSSSAHLILAEQILGFNPPGIDLEIALHAGTLLATVIFYGDKILHLPRSVFSVEGNGRRQLTALCIGTLPAAVVYKLFGKTIELTFERLGLALCMLACTGVALLSLKLIKRQGRTGGAEWREGVVVGLAQAFALLPGISRSGATIVAGRHMGLRPDEAAEFSFLLSIPAVSGAVLIKSLERVGQNGPVSLPLLLLATAISAAVGYSALVWLIRLLRREILWLFGLYCLALSFMGGLLLLRFTP